MINTALFNIFWRTAFLNTSFTQGGVSDRPSRNFALGYYILALQAERLF
jgi:hypothetical protein